jgi:hypothetical protein
MKPVNHPCSVNRDMYWSSTQTQKPGAARVTRSSQQRRIVSFSPDLKKKVAEVLNLQLGFDTSCCRHARKAK